ncbi:hypothetical protein [Parendozoicomonas sp. Alg238-R29]|uniref:hypothetical protein n=1 Tax=Parendozoicomonas sp. Alg238-R29 TaxID=2993446 RepID=UPI00248D6116|nr:hypothetical protein [Parendozoicomonas sp. Alg238-R29]
MAVAVKETAPTSNQLYHRRIKFWRERISEKNTATAIPAKEIPVLFDRKWSFLLAVIMHSMLSEFHISHKTANPDITRYCIDDRLVLLRKQNSRRYCHAVKNSLWQDGDNIFRFQSCIQKRVVKQGITCVSFCP